MPIPIQFWKMTKEVNSTKRPIAAATVTHQCSIKAPCSILTPDIELYMPLDTNNPSPLNYCFIEAFDRYYWVRDWEWSGSYWTAHCEVDVLASWKNSIGASQQYVLRSAAKFDGDIIDGLYPAKSPMQYEISQIDSRWASELSDGTYVLGVSGGGGGGFDPDNPVFTCYYLFTPGSLYSFFQYIFSDAFLEDLIGGPWAAIWPEMKAQVNPLQYISSLTWFPMKLEASTEVRTIRVGYVDVSAACNELPPNGLVHYELVFNTRKHPYSSDRGAYMNNAPFADYELYFPPFGVIQLDPNIVCVSSQIHALCTTDLRTGDGTLNIFNDQAVVLSTLHSAISVPVQMTEIVQKGIGLSTILNTAATLSSTIPSIGGAVASGFSVGNARAVLSGAADTVNAIGNALSNNIPTARTIGSNGGIDSLRGNPAMQYKWKIPVPDDNEHRGRPLCQKLTISSIPGYMTIADPEIDFTCTSEEGVAIRSFMTGGFYYE